MMKRLLTLLLVFFGLIGLDAQTFTEVEGTPFTAVAAGSIAFADVNNDSYQDVLITGSSTAKLYTNDGTGQFMEMANTPFTGVFSGSTAFADVNNDSYQDVLITGGGIAKLYTNDGTGHFTETANTPFIGVFASSIAFADVNNDSHQDVLITGAFNNGLIAKLYVNDGTGQFTEMVNTPFTGLERGSIAFADVNNDSHQDVLITGYDGSNRIAKLYTNDGTGQFTETTNTPFASVERSSIAFADVNGDSHQDVLITGSSNSGRIAKLYENDGTGQFTEMANTPFAGVSSSSIAFADVNNDSYQDVLITGHAYGNFIARLYTNDGTGQFTETVNTPFTGVVSSSIAFADVNNDSYQDVLITGTSNSVHIAKLYINDGSPLALSLSNGTVCANAEVLTLGGGSPEGGVYSGAGVMDGGNGQTFTFNPSIGPGTYTVAYALNGDTITAALEVLPLPDVSFTAPAPFLTNEGLQPLTGGMPVGGTYSGDGVVDNGDGTYSFDPSVGAGTYTITYTFMDMNGCSASANEDIVVKVAVDGDVCMDATDINNLFGQAANEPQTSGLVNNNDATTDASDPDFGFECFGDSGTELDRTLWFSFTGDGNTYRITTVECNSTDYIDFGDTQMAIYSGECDDLTAEACNDDLNVVSGAFQAYLEFPTEEGVEYRIMIDGYDTDDGEFCVEVTKLVELIPVTFNVDMAVVLEMGGSIDPAGVHIAGSFQGFDPGASQMIDNGDSTWSYIAMVEPNQEIQYKFINGNTFDGGQEGQGGMTNITQECGTDDGFGGFNRVLQVGEEEISTTVYCFDYCVTCDMVVGTDEETLRTSIEVFPNPVRDILNVQIDLPAAAESLNLRLLNTLGQVVLSSNYSQLQSDNIELDMIKLPAGTYLLQVRDGQAQFVRSVIIQR